MTTSPSWPTDLGHWVIARRWLGLIVAAAIVAAVFGYDQLLAWRHRRFVTGARWVTIRTWNDNPRPYVWTKTADQILESIARYCTRINDSRH